MDQFNRRDFLQLAGLSSASAALFPSLGKSEEPTFQALEKTVAPNAPNIVFIITDDQRWDYLGCMGHPVLKTPHIDRLAKEGALFRNFFTCIPLCSPSRASFLTGLYPHSHLVINNDKLGLDVISYTLITFPRQLREAGYETAFLGKWHMGLNDSRRIGFDTWFSFKGQGVYIDGTANDNGVERQLDGYMTDILNARAVEFIQQRHTKPFCLYLAHKAVHAPHLPAPRHSSLYADYQFKLPPKNPHDIASKPVMSRPKSHIDVLDLEGVAPEPGDSRRGRGNTPQAVVLDQLRCLASVDEGVGAIRAALERSGQLDNTIIIFTSDNGYLMGEHGIVNEKRWAYDESIRVPMVMRYPKLIAPKTVQDALVLNVDIAPTLLDLAGVKSIVPMHGHSLVPLLRDAKAPWRDKFLAEYYLEKCAPITPSWRAVRSDNWKYIHYYNESDNLDELYDLRSDPKEEKNLAGDAGAQPALHEMRQALEQLLKTAKRA